MRSKSAFTLIELLVVIAIIAILAAILFPVFARAKVAAKGAATISNQKQLALGVHMYAADYDDWTVLHESPSGGAPAEMYLLQRLHPYIKNIDIFWDAGASRPNNPASYTSTNPNGYWGGWTRYHNLSVNGPGLLGWWSGSTFNYGRILGAQEEIARRAMFINTDWPGFAGWGWYQFLNYTAIAPNYTNANDFWANQVYMARGRHSDKLVVAYADGHAGKVPAGRIFKPAAVAYWDFYNGERLAFWGSYWSATE